jgi:exodeoxyribonuclease VII small subunit
MAASADHCCATVRDYQRRQGATMMAAPSGGRIPQDSQIKPGEQEARGTCVPTGRPTFEQTLGRLEQIVHELEEGKIGLDEALARYEEGVGLLRTANDLLAQAERRISLLSGVDPEGNPILRPMEDAASFSLEQEVAGGGAPAYPRVGEKNTSRRGRRQAESDLP